MTIVLFLVSTFLALPVSPLSVSHPPPSIRRVRVVAALPPQNVDQKREFAMNIGKAMDVLRHDIPLFLHEVKNAFFAH